MHYPKRYALLYNSIIKNSFSQFINKPTRNNNIIDLLYTYEKQLLSNIIIKDYIGLYKNISDHNYVSFNVNIEKYPCKIYATPLAPPLNKYRGGSIYFAPPLKKYRVAIYILPPPLFLLICIY